VEIPAIKSALPALGASFVLEVEGLRTLRHLVAVGLRDRQGAASEAQASVAGALAPYREGEIRPWWPHVTLARGKGVDSADPKSLPSTIETESMTLYRSHPHSRYEAL